MSASLTDVSTHFAFGENWQDFLQHVDDDAIQRANDGLQRTLQGRSIAGKSFLDIGCGSGLSSLAAISLGAKRIVAIDIDPKSVAATRALLASKAPDADVEVREMSVFDADPAEMGTFDIVYSWGVLHHTGSMWKAIERTTSFVSPGGMLLIALYRRSRLCWAWRIEKRWYSSAPKWQQAIMCKLYKGAYFLANPAIGRSASELLKRAKARGMNHDNDIHDWLGGYPYESASLQEVIDRTPAGFRLESHCDAHGAPIHKRARLGAFGSGCDEYLFQRIR